MTCNECNARMRCVYTTPVEANLRFRLYKCAGCKIYDESLEIPKKMIANPELKEVMEKGRRRRFFFATRLPRHG